MSDYTEAANYMLLAAESNDSWMKDRALRRGADELTRLQSEVERLRAQVEDLEDECRNAQKYMVWLSGGKEVPTVKAWLLRKQAGAVEAFGATTWTSANRDSRYWLGKVNDYAQRLRQQADEGEKAGG